MKSVLGAALLALALPASPLGAEPLPSQVRVGPTVPLTIQTARGPRRFRVEVARTGAQQELGLMYRTKMPADHGMIFPMKPARMASFWMKNTLISLDLLFIREDGTISSIAPNAPTRSLDTIDSIEPVAAVLELNAGAAARAGIRPGDKVRW